MQRRPTQTLILVLLLGGCGPGRNPDDNPITWWHQLEGGAIAEQRPPPPGLDAPYPLVGTTPPRPGVMSVAARDALTASLIDQQGASHQLDTHDPIIVTTAAPPSAKPPSSPPTSPPSSSTATLDAAGTDPIPVPSPSQPAPAQPAPAQPAPLKPVATVEQQESQEPILAMPPPPPGTALVVASGPLPQMPASPPSPPAFPGFDVPVTPLRPVRPHLAGRALQLANIEFQPGSDVLLPTDRAALQHAASTRGAAPIRVLGNGEARSDTPDAQAAALRLALARAASAATQLEQLGVPSASIVVAGDAFGRGGSVTVVH